MDEAARNKRTSTNAQAEAATCEKPVSPNCDGTALYTVILNMPDGAITVPCCEPCRDEHVKRAKAEGVPVTVRTGPQIKDGPRSPGWPQRVTNRVGSWSSWQWLALGIIVLLLIAATVIILRLL